MKLLLDTHIWIWSYLEPHKVSSEVVRELSSPENERATAKVFDLTLVTADERLTQIPGLKVMPSR